MQDQILIPGSKATVFISSRIGEFAEERREITRLIREVLKMEAFCFEELARPHPPREVYKSCLEQSQFFVGIYGTGYGWIDDAAGMEVSGIHDEWRLACERPLLAQRRLAFIKETKDPREPRMNELLSEVRGVTYTTFRTRKELVAKVEASLRLLINEIICSTTGDYSVSLPDYGAELAAHLAPEALIETDFFRRRVLPSLTKSGRLLLHGPPGIGKTVHLHLLSKRAQAVYISLRNRSLLEVLGYLAGHLAVLVGRSVEQYPTPALARFACEALMQEVEALLLFDDVDQNPDIAAYVLALPTGSCSMVLAGRSPVPGAPSEAIALSCEGLSGPESATHISSLAPGASEDFVREACLTSRGNPLYLKYVSMYLSDRPLSSLDGYHARIWADLSVACREVLGLLALCCRACSIDELGVALTHYRHSPHTSVAVKKEIDHVSHLLTVRDEAIAIGHPAFAEYIATTALGAGTTRSLHASLAAAYEKAAEAHFRAYHLICAGDQEGAYDLLPEAAAQAFFSGEIPTCRFLLAHDIRLSKHKGNLFRIAHALYHGAVLKHGRAGDRGAVRIAALAAKLFERAQESEWSLAAREMQATYSISFGVGDETIRVLERARRHWAEAGLLHLEAATRTNLAYAYAKLGRFLECEKECIAAKELHSAAGDAHGYALALVNLNNVYVGRGLMSKLLTTARELQELSKELGMPRLEAAAQNALTIYYRRRKQYNLAETAARKSLDIARRLEDWDCVATNVGNLGNVFQGRGQYDQARECFEELEAIGTRRKALGHVAMARMLKANLADDEGDERQAIQLANEAIALWAKIPNTYRLAGVHADQARRYTNASQWKDAIESHVAAAEEFLVASICVDSMWHYRRAIELAAEHISPESAVSILDAGLARAAASDSATSMAALLEQMREYGGRLAGHIDPKQVRERVTAALSGTWPGRDLLDLVRGLAVAMKTIGASARSEYLAFIEDVVDLYSREEDEDTIGALAICVEQIQSSIGRDALTDLFKRIGELGPGIAYRHEDWLGDQWLVFFEAPKAPIVEIRSRPAQTLNERIAAAVAAMLVWRQRGALTNAISGLGWARVGWQAETFSEGDARQHKLPLPAHFPDELPVVLAVPAEEIRDKQFCAMFVSDTYLSSADHLKHPWNRCIISLALQLLDEITEHFAASKLSRRAAVRLRQRIMTETLGVTCKPSRGPNGV